MKAMDLTKVIKKHEDSLKNKLGTAVNEALNSIAEETGLEIDDMALRIKVVTSTADTSKKYELVNIHIYTSLPSHH